MIKPITATNVGTDAPTRSDYDKKSLSNRGTYSPVNAEAFRSVFDDMIVSGQNKEIDSRAVGLKPSSLYVKAQDALKWLSECDVKNKDGYAILRSRVSMRRLSGGLLIYYKPSIANIIQKGTATVKMDTTWKDDLMSWLEGAKDGDIFHKDGIVVEDLDRTWLTALLAGLAGEVEMDITATSVRVMR